MKTLLLILLTCLPLWAATTYPMLSTTTNRTVTGGVTNLSFLNSNSVFTGTARWMGIATLTNTGNIFVGDGSGLTGVGMVTSGGLATNATIYGLTVATGQTNTHLTASSIVTTDANKGIISGTTTADLATLSANQTFTGTNTFSSAVIATNTGSIFAGNGVGLTNMGQFRFRILFKTNSLYTASIRSDGGTEGTFTATNYVGASTSTNIMNLTLPALMSTNSKVGIMAIGERTNAIHSNVYMDFVVGSNLCFAAGVVSQTTAPRNYMGYINPFGIEIFRNYGSFTTQLIQVPSAALTTAQPQFYIPASYIDTTTNWNLSVGLMPNATVIPVTNIFIREFLLVEQWTVD